MEINNDNLVLVSNKCICYSCSKIRKDFYKDRNFPIYNKEIEKLIKYQTDKLNLETKN